MKHFFMLRYFWIILVSFLPLHVPLASAQQLSTQLNNLVTYNPAYSLISETGSINLAARRQWVGIDGAPTSYLLTGNIPITNIKGSFGLTAMQNKYGVDNQNEVSLFFAKAISLSENVHFAVSLNGGLISRKANYSFLDPFDPQFARDINEKTAVIGVGILLYEPERFYISASLPSYRLKSLGNYKPSFYFAAGYLLTPDALVSVKPALLISYTSNIPLMANGSATFYFNHRFGLGLGYSTTKEASGIASVIIGNNFLMGYSYQIPIGNSGSFNLATHEISLCIRFGKTDRFGLL